MMKKKNLTKPLRYIKLIYKLANSPSQSISLDEFSKIMEVKKTSKYDIIRELTTEYPDLPPVINYNKQKKTISLNRTHWQTYVTELKKGELLLQCVKSLSNLVEAGFDQDDIRPLQSMLLTHEHEDRNLTRKFIYLAKVKSRPFNEKQTQFLQKITSALIENTKLIINYIDENKNIKTYSIAPLTLCQHRDDLYLIGARGLGKNLNLRTFKIMRIDNLYETSETFKYPGVSRYNPEEMYHYSSGLINKEIKVAYFRVYSFSRRIFKEKNFFDHKLLDETETYDEYQCYYTNPNEFLGQLFIYAQDIQILSPAELEDQFLEKAKQAINNHRSKKILKIAS